MTPLPQTRDLVLIGGGHAHALVLRMWGMAPLAGVRLTLIDPEPVAAYTGMLPGFVAGHYHRCEMMIDLVRLARHAGAALVFDKVAAIDRDAGQIILPGRAPLRYDVASINIGIGSSPPDLAGFAAHGVAAKPLGPYADRWVQFLAKRLARPRIVILGAGLGGVELALASAHRLRVAGAVPEVTLIDRSADILQGTGQQVRTALLAHLAQADVQVIAGATATLVEAGAVVLSDGRSIASDFTVGTAGAQPQAWLGATGLTLNAGFVATGPTLQSSDSAIFAVGDCAQMTHAPRAKAGVFAVRQAPVLHHNLRAALSGRALRQFWPQRDYLKLVSTGGKGAVADKWGLRLDGAWLWTVKDRIDRSFMRKFADFPAMPAPVLPAERALGLDEMLGKAPLCGGCGAKVGAAELTAALIRLPAPQRADVLSGRGDDAAVLRCGDGVQVMTTDHLRAFTGDPWLMARSTAIHALGDIWAMGAAPQAALAQITVPRMSGAMQTATLAAIMSAAAEVFGAAGADVVGGHTSVGAELTVGFTVTGLATRAIGKGGAVPGDALILTKAIGTGTILAAEMAMARVPGILLGEAVAAAFASMTRPMTAASQLLAAQANAMTDVTGFGLAGHLLEMLDASGCSARLESSSIPLLAGAEALAGAGYASSLAPANRGAVRRMAFTETARAALLFDPQTAGGLLAAVPATSAEALVAALRANGDEAAIIGQIEAGPPFITLD